MRPVHLPVTGYFANPDTLAAFPTVIIGSPWYICTAGIRRISVNTKSERGGWRSVAGCVDVPRLI